MNEFRVIGPPGTGKTTYLCEQARLGNNVDPFSGGILFSSLTKAAIGEFRGRGISIDEERVGTLHAHAYRALGSPPLCVNKKQIDEWNAACAFGHQLSGGSERPDQDEKPNRKPGDRLFEEYTINRSRLRPRDQWANRVLAFADEYETWKRVNGYRDFTDVIHDAYKETESAPGCPDVILVDEAQDHDRAELRLLRKWAKNAEKLILVGDPDQCLFSFRGSDPEAFYEVAIPPENTTVLAQSYRVPRAVHAKAMRLLGRVRDRVQVDYFPRDEEGCVRSHPSSFVHAQMADYIIDDAEHRYLAQGKTVMFLASCEYQLRPLRGQLKERGIPFWNPYARDNGAFNPLHPSKGTSAIQRVLAYLLPSPKVHGDKARMWTPADMLDWLDSCNVKGLLRHGAKAELARLAKSNHGPLSSDQIKGLMEGGIVPDDFADLKISFLESKLNNERRSTMEYATRIVRKHGVAAIKENPRVVIGTIHSCKGGEADAVYVAPELSPGFYDELESSRPNPVLRMFYVAMTRARHDLILCEPHNCRCIHWGQRR